MMKKTIDQFIKDKKVALVGASRNPQKGGNALTKMLKKKGYTVYPVNRREREIEGLACFSSVAALPPEVANVILSVSAAAAVEVLRECAGTGVRRVWLHRGAGGEGASSAEAGRAARGGGLGG